VISRCGGTARGDGAAGFIPASADFSNPDLSRDGQRLAFAWSESAVGIPLVDRDDRLLKVRAVARKPLLTSWVHIFKIG
jgi:hypothetical protein